LGGVHKTITFDPMTQQLYQCVNWVIMLSKTFSVWDVAEASQLPNKRDHV